MRPTLLSIVEPSERDQLNQELNEIVNRQRKVKDWVDNRMGEVKEMEPMSREHEEHLLPVQTVNEDVADELRVKPRTGVNLKKIEEEKERVKDLKKKLDEIKPEVRELRANQTEVKVFHAEEVDKKPVEEEATEAIKTHDDLRQQVLEYLDDLDHIHDKAEKFFEDVNEIKNWAPAVEDSLKDCETTSKDPEDLKKELAALEAIQKDIEKKRPTVFVIEDNGNWLQDNMSAPTGKTPRRQSTAGEVPQRMAEVTSIMNQLDDELNARKTRINAILADALSFEEAAREFDKWLTAAEKKLDNEKPISTDLEEVKKQVLEHKPLHEDIEAHDPVYNSLVYSAQSLLGRNPEESKELPKTLKDLTDRYNKVNEISKKRDDDLTKMVPLLRTFETDNHTVDETIEEGENTLQKIEPVAFDAEEGDSLLKNVKV